MMWPKVGKLQLGIELFGEATVSVQIANSSLTFFTRGERCIILLMWHSGLALALEVPSVSGHSTMPPPNYLTPPPQSRPWWPHIDHNHLLQTCVREKFCTEILLKQFLRNNED